MDCIRNGMTVTTCGNTSMRDKQTGRLRCTSAGKLALTLRRPHHVILTGR